MFMYVLNFFLVLLSLGSLPDIYSPLPLFAVSLHGVGRMLLHPPPTATEPSSGPAILPNAEGKDSSEYSA